MSKPWSNDERIMVDVDGQGVDGNMACGVEFDGVVPFAGWVHMDGRLGRPNSWAQSAFLCDWACYIKGMVGGLGGGKTATLVQDHWDKALANGTMVQIEGDPIKSIFVEPTYRLLDDVAMPIFKRLIYYTEKLNAITVVESEDRNGRTLTLSNGHEILLRSVDRPETLHGPTVSHVSADELTSWRHVIAYTTLLSRVRDVRATVRQFAYTTRPESGHWCQSEICDRGRMVPRNEYPDWWETNRWYHIRTYDNVDLPQEYRRIMEESMSARAYRQYIEGLWLPAKGVVYDEFLQSEHVVPYRIRRSQGASVLIGIDPGPVYPSALVLAPYKGDEWIVVKEYVRDRVTVESVLRAIREDVNTYQWRVLMVAIDPNDQDVHEWAKKTRKILGVYAKHSGAKKYKSTVIGREVVHTLLRDRRGRTRLRFSRGLLDDAIARKAGKEERGVIKSIQNHKYPQRVWGYGDKPIHDIYCHIMDALRYACVRGFPQELDIASRVYRDLAMG